MIKNPDRLSFVYSFDVSKTIQHFKLLPDSTQMAIESNIAEVIYESFVIPADQDYLTARLLAQNGLPRGFYWAAAQAVEKYFKAYLLMNGVSIKELSHNHPIKKLWAAVSEINPTFTQIDVSPHNSIKVDSDYSKLFKKFSINEFLDVIEKHGNADNRYNSAGVEYRTGILCALDSLIHKFRPEIGATEIEKSFKNISSDLILIFQNNNPWICSNIENFEHKIPSKEFPLNYSTNVTHLDYLRKNKSGNESTFALQWLKEMMKLPPGI